MSPMALRSTLVALIALSAAFCYAASNVIEQRKAAGAPAETSLRIALLWHLAHEPIWWLGILVDLGGFGFQVLALRLGSLTFVQPMLVTSLLFSLLLGSRMDGVRAVRSDLAWAAVLTASLAVFLAVASPSGGFSERPFRAWITPLILVGGVIGCCLTIARRSEGAVRAAFLAAAAGTSFGVSSTLMKSFAHLLTRGPVALLTHWEPYALGFVIAMGFLILQSAFQAGDLRAALPALEVAEPIVACVLGLLLMRERLHAGGPLPKALIAMCIAAMGWSTVQLAHSATVLHARAGSDADADADTAASAR